MSGTPAPPNTPEKVQENLTWAEFLESTPPGETRVVDFLAVEANSENWIYATPKIKLYCDNKACDKVTFFDPSEDGGWHKCKRVFPVFLKYVCRHCRESSKLFAVEMMFEPSSEQGIVAKIGELPPFGPHVPTRVNQLLGPDRNFFFKGRRAESQGMGIGAFGYYRRLVENQKNRIIDEIIKVSKRINVAQTIIDQLTRAKDENQFSKSIESIKDAIPEVLKIDGHNPLLLLHSALSEGLHAQTDEECLELATSIRIVITKLAERIEIALKEEAEIKGAISRLVNKKSAK